MDDFEVYIQSNKSQFNEPPLDKNQLWEKIEQQLDTKQTKVITISQTWLKVAAVALLFMGLSFLASQFTRLNPLAIGQKISPEIVEVKAHYNHLIHLKLNEIDKTKNISTQEKTTFLSAVEELNIESDDLQKELKQQVNNSVVIEAIIQNYKQQMWLLERLQKRIDKLKVKNYEQGIII